MSTRVPVPITRFDGNFDSRQVMYDITSMGRVVTTNTARQANLAIAGITRLNISKFSFIFGDSPGPGSPKAIITTVDSFTIVISATNTYICIYKEQEF